MSEPGYAALSDDGNLLGQLLDRNSRKGHEEGKVDACLAAACDKLRWAAMHVS